MYNTLYGTKCYHKLFLLCNHWFIINSDQTKKSTNSDAGTETTSQVKQQSSKLPPIRFSKFRLDDIVYIFPLQNTAHKSTIFELLQDSRQSSARYFVNKILSKQSDTTVNNHVTMSSSTKSLSSSTSNSHESSVSSPSSPLSSNPVPQLAKIVNISRCEVKRADNKYGIKEVGEIFYLTDVVILQI